MHVSLGPWECAVAFMARDTPIICNFGSSSIHRSIATQERKFTTDTEGYITLPLSHTPRQTARRESSGYTIIIVSL